jgi:hypothetical protein
VKLKDLHDLLFSFLLKSYLKQINEEVYMKRGTVGNLRSVDYLLKHTFIKHNKYVVDQTLEYFGVSFT